MCRLCRQGRLTRLAVAILRPAPDGFNFKQLADLLGVTPKTIERHSTILRRMNGVEDYFQLGAKLARTPQEHWVL